GGCEFNSTGGQVERRSSSHGLAASTRTGAVSRLEDVGAPGPPPMLHGVREKAVAARSAESARNGRAAQRPVPPTPKRPTSNVAGLNQHRRARHHDLEGAGRIAG